MLGDCSGATVGHQIQSVFGAKNVIASGSLSKTFPKNLALDKICCIVIS